MPPENDDKQYVDELEKELESALNNEADDEELFRSTESSHDDSDDEDDEDDDSTESEPKGEDGKGEDKADEKPDEKPEDEPDKKADEPEQEVEQEVDASTPDKSDNEHRVPVQELTKTRRELRKAERSSREKDDEIQSLKDKLETATLKAEANGVDISTDKEFTADDYKAMVEEGREREADVMLAQQRKINKLESEQQADDTAAREKQQRDQDADDAIAANDSMRTWRNNAVKGKTAAWNLAVEIESNLEGEFESIDDRFAEVERLTLEALEKAVEDAPEADKSKSLNDVAGTTGKTSAAERAFDTARSSEDVFDAWEGANESEREEIEAKLFT